jgi:16S rRNA (cytosine1402-N4)-methyltransferase
LNHQPVLLDEVILHLNIKPDGRYVDGTLGLAGHAVEIAKRLGPNGRLLGLDVDSTTLPWAESRLQPFGNLTKTRQVNFRGLQRVLQEEGWGEVDGMLFDLGFSSVQMDDGGRGFSFQKEGPLDMRLDPKANDTALSILQTIKETDLVNQLTQYGEARQAKRLARLLLSETANGQLKTTTDLARVCEMALGRHGKTHPATRVFLALRAIVNREEEALNDLLTQAPNVIGVGGRLLIITFQGIEDKLVKHAFKNIVDEGLGNKRFALPLKKPVIPSDEEIVRNPRARSAKLRILERVA